MASMIASVPSLKARSDSSVMAPQVPISVKPITSLFPGGSQRIRPVV